MSYGLLQLTFWALLMTTMASAEFATVEKVNENGPGGRIFLNNLNSTLIPLGSSGALLATTLVVVAVVFGAIFLFSIIFSPHLLKGEKGLFGGLFGGGLGGPGGYPQYHQGGGQYGAYAPQTQPYLYEPYSKLGYQTPATRSSENGVDWDSLKILDYISMMEEMWRTLDVKDVGCQKRILCEIHQNESALGPAASKIVNIFGYTRYLSMLNIPDSMKNMIDDYQEAADKGRSLKDQDCKDVFDSCDFSVKETFLKKFKNLQD